MSRDWLKAGGCALGRDRDCAGAFAAHGAGPDAAALPVQRAAPIGSPMPSPRWRRWRWASGSPAGSLSSGSAIFAGSLYLLAFGAPGIMGAITPMWRRHNDPRLAADRLSRRALSHIRIEEGGDILQRHVPGDEGFADAARQQERRRPPAIFLSCAIWATSTAPDAGDMRLGRRRSAGRRRGGGARRARASAASAQAPRSGIAEGERARRAPPPRHGAACRKSPSPPPAHGRMCGRD